VWSAWLNEFSCKYPFPYVFWSKSRFSHLKQGYVAPILKSSLQKSQSGSPLRNIHISNDNGSFTFYVDVFFPLSLPRLLPDFTVYMSNIVFVLSYCVSLRYEFPVVMSVTISAWKRCSVRLCFQLFVWGSCLIYIICVCLHVVVSNTHCVVCFFPFVLCTLCWQFLWIAHLWLTPSVFSGIYLYDFNYYLYAMLNNAFILNVQRMFLWIH